MRFIRSIEIAAAHVATESDPQEDSLRNYPTNLVRVQGDVLELSIADHLNPSIQFQYLGR